MALNRITGFGPRLFADVFSKWPNLAKMFALSANKLESYGIPGKIAKAIANFDCNMIDVDWRWEAQSNKHRIITILDKSYPELLRHIASPPLVLYTIGNIASLSRQAVAMVGSRRPSVAGLENSYRFAFDLAKASLSIVSGLAIGIDGRAHEGALAVGGITIAVLGSGIDNIYPYRHLALAERICENGLLISEFPLKMPPKAGHFPRRNRIISGLALATLVVEAAVRSGSLITARFALEQNRDVLAIPGSIHNQQASGCHKLLQQGAKLVTSYTDVLDELNLPSGDVECPVLSLERGLLNYIGYEVTSVDQLITRSGWPINDIMCDLAKLELKGIVSAVPGGYMRCK